MSNIWAVVKDPGGINAVLPVVLYLRGLGHEVLLITCGKATELLQDKDLGEVACESAEQVMALPNLPDLLITCMSSGGGIGRDLVPLLKERGVITIAIQDYPGARLFTAWADIKFRPDYICVNDSLSADLVHEAWSEYDIRRVLKLGHAALDQYADLDIEAVSASTREKLGISATEVRRVILYGGQINATGQTLMNLVHCLNSVDQEVILIARPHPRMSDDAQEEFSTWEEAIKLFKGEAITDSSSCLPKEVIAAADLVISMFSTMLSEAASIRKSVISILMEGTGRGMEAFLSASEGGRKSVPVVDQGCCKLARTEAELQVLLGQFFDTGDLGLQPQQEKVFQLDGGNAERIGEFVLSLV